MARKKKEELEVVSTKSNILLEEKFDKEKLTKEIKDYVDEQVKNTFFEELEKTNKKLIREKNKKIIWRNIVIILLLLIIGFLLFIMHRYNYFDKFFNKTTPIEEKQNKEENKEDKKDDKENKKDENKEEKKEEKPKEPTLDELKKEYSNLLDNYYVTDSSIYLSDYYDGKLTNDMMKYMTINSFNFETFDKEEDYNIIKEATFQTMFEKLFNEKYISGTFNYDENKLRYVKPMESYMSESVLIREENNIVREIKDIKVVNDKIQIMTVEGVVKDNKLYNVITNDEVSGFNNDSLIKYQDKLNTLIYTFKDNKLISLSK